MLAVPPHREENRNKYVVRVDCVHEANFTQVKVDQANIVASIAGSLALTYNILWHHFYSLFFFKRHAVHYHDALVFFAL
jgi:hypothetical protein